MNFNFTRIVFTFIVFFLCLKGGVINAQNTDLDFFEARELVRTLYHGSLFREADLEGLDFHSGYVMRDGYQGLISRANRLVLSNEFESLVIPFHSSKAIISNMYKNYFQRSSEDGNLWHTYLESGNPTQTSKGIVGSNEFFAKNVAPLEKSKHSIRSLELTKVAAGSFHTCGVKDENLLCWGDGRYGQTSIPKGMTEIKQLVSGHAHSCALASEGVKCWGQNNHGQTAVPPALKGITEIAAAGDQTCAIDESGVTCWGNKRYAASPPSLAHPTNLAMGREHACVLNNQRIECWGSNQYGQLNAPNPVYNVKKLVAGYAHMCVLDDVGLRCWGNNLYGQTQVTTQQEYIEDVWAGGGQTCVLENSSLKCWGNNSYRNNHIPPTVSMVKNLTIGLNHLCSFDEKQSTCWGSDGFGQ